MNPFLGRFSDSIIYSKRCLGIKWGSSACIGEFIASSNIGEYDYSMFKILNHEKYAHYIFMFPCAFKTSSFAI